MRFCCFSLFLVATVKWELQIVFFSFEFGPFFSLRLVSSILPSENFRTLPNTLTIFTQRRTNGLEIFADSCALWGMAINSPAAMTYVLMWECAHRTNTNELWLAMSTRSNTIGNYLFLLSRFMLAKRKMVLNSHWMSPPFWSQILNSCLFITPSKQQLTGDAPVLSTFSKCHREHSVRKFRKLM